MQKIQDVADDFVRVRLARIEESNLNVFEFDYDLTFMIFFLSPDERVYARYGGRCEKGPDARQSLAGLRYTMESVLREHRSNNARYAPMKTGDAFYIREIAPAGLGSCIHCHQAKEVIYDRLYREGKWNTDLAFRYPPPDNLGLTLDVDRGNVVAQVVKGSPADKAGIQKHDVLRMLNDVPIHSFGDAQFALDRAPKTGFVEASWRRGDREMRGKIELPVRWRRTDVSWRASLQNFIASARVYGKDLSAEEKAALRLPAAQLAFRQNKTVTEQARKAGVRPGDVIIGVDDRALDMDAYNFLLYVRTNYVKGEIVTLNVIRDGRRLNIPMLLE